MCGRQYDICEPKPETSALHLREQKSCGKPLYLLTGLHPAPTVFTDSRGSHVDLDVVNTRAVGSKEWRES